MSALADAALVDGVELDGLVTVIIPARDEEAWIGRCLESVLGQDFANLQVIVVDGASSDRTEEIVRGYGHRDRRVELVRVEAASSIPGSLNTALRRARGRVLVRVDAHSTIPSDYVRRAVALLAGGDWAGVGGRKDGVGITTSGHAIARALGSPFGVGNSAYHHGKERRTVDHVPFGAYRTDLVRELGGWDERLVANEDFELDYRIRREGRQLLFDPELRIEWVSRQSMRDLMAQYRRYGRGKADVARLHPRSLAARHLAAPALVAALAAGVALLGRRPRFLAGVLAAYGAGLAAATAREMKAEHDPAVLVRLPVAFATMHVGWGIGFWEGILKRSERRGPARAARV